MPVGGIRARTSGIMVPAFVAPTAAYQGPGDVVGGAYAWWGTRAYTAASIGQNAIDLFFSDTTVITYATIAGGGLNTTQIDADAVTHGAPILVDKLYDQTGNGRHLVLGGFTRPTFTTSGNGLTVPNVGVTVAGRGLTNTTFGTLAQPFTFMIVANHTASAVTQNLMVTVNGGNFVSGTSYRQTANNTCAGFAGTVGPDVTINDGTWACVQTTFNNATTDVIRANATTATGTALGANTVDTTIQFPHSGSAMDGFFTEAGIWGVEFNGTQLTNMYNNQKSYYGLP